MKLSIATVAVSIFIVFAGYVRSARLDAKTGGFDDRDAVFCGIHSVGLDARIRLGGERIVGTMELNASFRTVLLAEDPLLRAGVVAVLGAQGVEGIVATDSLGRAREAVACDEAAVAMVGTSMGGANALDCIRGLLEAFPPVGVLVLSDLARGEAATQALAAGARGYLSRASTGAELAEAVKTVASGKRFVAVGLRSTGGSPGSEARSSWLPWVSLAPREREVLAAVAVGRTDEEVGRELFISVETVRTHVKNALRKLEARSRTHAVVLALRRGELTLADLDD